MKASLCIFMMLFSSAAWAETYSECILNNMKLARTNAIAGQVKQACRKKVLPYVPTACKTNSCEDSNNFKPIEKFASRSDSGLFDDLLLEMQVEAEEHQKNLIAKCKVGPVWEGINSECIEKCLEASWWDKKFGDCRP